MGGRLLIRTQHIQLDIGHKYPRGKKTFGEHQIIADTPTLV